MSHYGNQILNRSQRKMTVEITMLKLVYRYTKSLKETCQVIKRVLNLNGGLLNRKSLVQLYQYLLRIIMRSLVPFSLCSYYMGMHLVVTSQRFESYW